MSSDVFNVRILEKENDRLVLRVLTGFAGGRNDFACTRSFALSALADARRRHNENSGRFRELEKGVPFRKATQKTALEIEKDQPPAWGYSEEFYKNNVGKYLTKTVIRARHNQSRADSFSAEEHERAQDLEDRGLPLHDFEAAMCETFHFIELEVYATAPRWLDGLEVGWCFGTTAYDAWWKDPLRPSAPRSTKVKKSKSAEGTSVKKPRQVAIRPGVRVQTHVSILEGVRGTVMELKQATITGSDAKYYKNPQFALVALDDGLQGWLNVPSIKAVAGDTPYEVGRADPEAFWARLAKLPMYERAREVGRAIGSGGLGSAEDPKWIRYPPRSRRVAGFFANLSTERAAQLISTVFAPADRPAKFDDYQPFEKSGGEFDGAEWRPFQGETRIKVCPKFIVSGLVGGLAWRIGQESAASGKGPAKLISKAALADLEKLPESAAWLKFFAKTKPVPAEPVRGEAGRFGLRGFVL